LGWKSKRATGSKDVGKSRRTERIRVRDFEPSGGKRGELKGKRVKKSVTPDNEKGTLTEKEAGRKLCLDRARTILSTGGRNGGNRDARKKDPYFYMGDQKDAQYE